MLFFESPSGVGFSSNPNQYGYDDNKTAGENMQALLNWFAEFPEYLSHKFWLAGESYAGMYIPFLADQILTYNDQQTEPDKMINLEGFLFGNGVFDNDDNKFENYTAG